MVPLALKKWNELPVELRRSEAKRWNYLVEHIEGSGENTPEPEQATKRNISISVTDGSSPLQGVNVTLVNSTDSSKTFNGSTGSAGGCNIRNVPEGTYNVEATLNGYDTYSGSLTVDSDETLEITMNVASTTYHFKSYDDINGTTLWGKGTVETTGTVTDGYTEVEVLSNNTDESFIGEKFFIISNAKTDGTIYELFTDAGTTSAGIFVSVSLTPYND